MRPLEIEEPAFNILRTRKACRPLSAATVRKEPVTITGYDARYYDADYLRDVLDGIEPCFSHVGDAPSVTSFSLNISWPPGHPQRRRQDPAFIVSCHQSLLLLCVGNCRPSNRQLGFYLVYNAKANSVAIVPPPLSCAVSSWSHCDIAGASVGAGVPSLKTKKHPKTNKRNDYYILVDLLLRRSHLPRTYEATLFMWKSRGPMSFQWLEREVLLPIPLPTEDQDNPFCADMVFAVGSVSIFWVDLLSGILVYNHKAAAAVVDTNQPLGSSAFHFIPLPQGYDAISCELRDNMHPEEYRSMCCDNGGKTLNFVSMDGYSQKSMAEVVITLWVLDRHRPLDRKHRSLWQLVRSVSIRDFWHNHLYNDLSLNPRFPVISTLEPDVIYVSVCNYKYNHKAEVLDVTELYVLSLCMRSQSVVSSFKVPCEAGIVPLQRLFTSQFSLCQLFKAGTSYHVPTFLPYCKCDEFEIVG